MGDLGVPELIIILAIIVAIWGPGNIADIGRVLGTTIRDFRRSLRSDDDQAQPTTEQRQM